MTSWVASTNARLSFARWLIIPATFGLFALVGLAISTEDRNELQARSAEDAPLPQPQIGQSVKPNDASGPDNGNRTTPSTSSNITSPETQPPTTQASATGGANLRPVSFEVRATNGRVSVELTGPGPVASPVKPDGTIGTPTPLQPDVSGTGASVRLNAQGQLEPVVPGDIRRGDLVLDAVDDAVAVGVGVGVDVIRPDGSRIQIRPSTAGSGLGLVTNEIDPSGQARPVAPDASGEIVVGDGVTIRLPSPHEAAGAPPSMWDKASTTPWRWIFLLVGALALVSALVARYLHRHKPDDPFGPGWIGPGGIPAHRFEEFLAMLSADPDPARAVRLAFLAAERGVANLPRRNSVDTPFEWYRRVVGAYPQIGEPLAALCSRFVAVRFGAEKPSADDRDAAVTALRELNRLGRALLIPADTIPADTTPADTIPADTTPADTTPADTGPADASPTEGPAFEVGAGV